MTEVWLRVTSPRAHGVGCLIAIGAVAAAVASYVAGRWGGGAAVAVALAFAARYVLRTRGEASAAAREAIARRPAALPAVEPELAPAPPRPWAWAPGPRSVHVPRTILVDRVASRAWLFEVTGPSHTPAGDPDRGEDPMHGDCTAVRFRFGYERDGATYAGLGYVARQGRVAPGDGPTDFDAWCREALREGGSFTVLTEPADPYAPRLYAEIEPYLPAPLAVAVDAARADPAALPALRARVRSALTMPLLEPSHPLVVELAALLGAPVPCAERPRFGVPHDELPRLVEVVADRLAAAPPETIASFERWMGRAWAPR